MIIEESTENYSSDLAARKIWKELFKISKAERFEDLDSFLCDLGRFQKYIEEMAWQEETILYWYYHMKGFTTIYGYPGEKFWDGCVRVTLHHPIKKGMKWNITLEVL
jgi:hypothetical protein